MDPITQIIAANKVPVGTWGKLFFDYLTTNFAWFFNGIAQSLTKTLEGTIHVVLAMPPIVVVLIASFFAWYLPRSVKLGFATAIGLLFIINLGFWRETIETLVLVVASTVVSMTIGVPVGIAAAREALTSFGSGVWSDWYNVADHRDHISLQRPFYPRPPRWGGACPSVRCPWDF